MPHESAWDELPSGDASRLERLCREFEEVCKKNGPPRIEEYLDGVSPRERRPLFRELLGLELAYRRKNGEQTFAAMYLERFPDETDLVRAEFVETTPDTHAEVNPIPHPHLQADLPSHLGRYQVIAKLGRGGFGTVYKGYDSLLQRAVAIKVPNKQRATQPDYAKAYVEEGRTLTGLDHPHIVKVYDLGETEDGMPFVVYEYIEGGDLEQRMKKGRLPFSAAAEVAWVVADALHYVHLKHRVHRDIKPGNILINGVGKPYLADFGIAIRDEDFGKGPEFVGTLKYMSPEQARHESHRVDGRSDVFSVGVVLYELLTGRAPFQGKTAAQLKEQITSVEPRPLRMIDDHIPKELERICSQGAGQEGDRALSDRFGPRRGFTPFSRLPLSNRAARRDWSPGVSGGKPGAEPFSLWNSHSRSGEDRTQGNTIVRRGRRRFLPGTAPGSVRPRVYPTRFASGRCASSSAIPTRHFSSG